MGHFMEYSYGLGFVKGYVWGQDDGTVDGTFYGTQLWDLLKGVGGGRGDMVMGLLMGHVIECSYEIC